MIECWKEFGHGWKKRYVSWGIVRHWMHPCPLIPQPANGTAPIRPDRAEITESILTLYPIHLGVHRSGNGFAIEHVGDWLQIDETTSSSRLERVRITEPIRVPVVLRAQATVLHHLLDLIRFRL